MEEQEDASRASITTHATSESDEDCWGTPVGTWSTTSSQHDSDDEVTRHYLALLYNTCAPPPT